MCEIYYHFTPGPYRAGSKPLKWCNLFSETSSRQTGYSHNSQGFFFYQVCEIIGPWWGFLFLIVEIHFSRKIFLTAGHQTSTIHSGKEDSYGKTGIKTLNNYVETSSKQTVYSAERKGYLYQIVKFITLDQRIWLPFH